MSARIIVPKTEERKGPTDFRIPSKDEIEPASFSYSIKRKILSKGGSLKMFPEGMLISVTLVIDRSRFLSRNEYALDYFAKVYHSD